jgi:hypothetical protein
VTRHGAGGNPAAKPTIFAPIDVIHRHGNPP